MFVYKLGQSYYEGNVDKNSGYFESRLIKNILKDEVDNDKFVIIGGKLGVGDKEVVKAGFSNRSKRIFVATDYTSLMENIELANSCSLVLHQALKDIPEVTTKQAYGYMPELFFKKKPKPLHQRDYILFAGSNLNRQDLIARYVYAKDDSIRSLMVPILKNYDTKEDKRLEYNEYIELLRTFKYSLVIVRSECRDIGWVTSRFVECISNYVYPIVDVDYDKMNHFLYRSNRVNNYKEVETLVENTTIEEIMDYIEDAKLEIVKNKNKFKEMILNV